MERFELKAANGSWQGEGTRGTDQIYWELRWPEGEVRFAGPRGEAERELKARIKAAKSALEDCVVCGGLGGKTVGPSGPCPACKGEGRVVSRRLK